MAIPTVAVGGKVTASEENLIVGGVNGIALSGIVPTSVAGTGVTVSALGAVTFTNATSVSLNGVFSGTYDNYRITWSSSTRSANVGVYFRLRQAGVDVATALYDYVRTKSSGTTSVVDSSSSATAAALDIAVATGQRTSGVFDIFGPALAAPMLGNSTTSTLAASALTSAVLAIACESTTPADGFTIYPGGSSTFSGTVRVYGYNNLP